MTDHIIFSAEVGGRLIRQRHHDDGYDFHEEQTYAGTCREFSPTVEEALTLVAARLQVRHDFDAAELAK